LGAESRSVSEDSTVPIATSSMSETLRRGALP
jgi:hypothetical protein